MPMVLLTMRVHVLSADNDKIPTIAHQRTSCHFAARWYKTKWRSAVSFVGDSCFLLVASTSIWQLRTEVKLPAEHTIVAVVTARTAQHTMEIGTRIGQHIGDL